MSVYCFVFCSVGPTVGWSVIIFYNCGKLHFHVPIGALVIYEKPSERGCVRVLSLQVHYIKMSLLHEELYIFTTIHNLCRCVLTASPLRWPDTHLIHTIFIMDANCGIQNA